MTRKTPNTKKASGPPARQAQKPQNAKPKRPASKKPFGNKTDNQGDKTPWPRLRLLGLFAVLVVGAIGYSVLWQAVARRLVSETEMQIISLENAGYQIRHGGIAVSGFPYRLSVDMTKPQFLSPSNAVTVEAENISFISHLWTPSQWVVDSGALLVSTPFSGNMALDRLKASWRRLGESGQRLIVDASGAEGQDFRLNRAIIGLVLPGEAERAASAALLGDKIAAITLNMAGTGWTIEGATVLSGVPLYDWSEPAFKRFRDWGGLWDLTELTLRLQGYPISIKGSLTLDQNLALLGTLDIDPKQALPPQSGLAGQLQSRIGLKDRPLNISLQNGELYVNGTYKGDIPPFFTQQ